MIITRKQILERVIGYGICEYETGSRAVAARVCQKAKRLIDDIQSLEVTTPKKVLVGNKLEVFTVTIKRK